MITTLGALFHIEEMNIKDVLMKLLKETNVQQAEQEIQERIRKTIKTPKSAFQNSRCHCYRTWLFDPTVVLDRDIIDHKGRVLKKRGATYNPLLYKTMSTQLFFIEGTDEDQIAWALKQPHSKIVLVNGSPIELEEKHQQPIYFDQRGFLCSKFGISTFPARVFQQQNVLRCEELPLPSNS